jgi:hemolysin activation/secretion protein
MFGAGFHKEMNSLVRSRYLASLLVANLGLASAPLWADEGKFPLSNFNKSLRGEFDRGVTPFSQSDITKDYLYRTVDENAPKLDAAIPEQNFREEGPRILVKKFDFHRLQEFPEAGVTRDKVEGLAEELRVKYMKEDQTFASGYTRGELEELAGFLNKVGARENPENLTPESFQQFISIVKQQNAERGINYTDLEEITSELTHFYRRNGLFLAQVQIPAQEVKDGVISLTVQEGRLGKVVVEDNQRYSETALTTPFGSKLGGLVSHAEMEEGLYLLNDLPGLNVTGYFSAGDSPGETALNLKVRKEKNWKVAMRADNHGSTFTGDERLYTVGELLNPLGIGDTLTLGYLRSEDPGKSDLAQFKYSMPIMGPRTRLEISADRNEFALEDGESENALINQLEIEGVNSTYALNLDHKFHRSRDFNLSAGIGLTQKKTDVEAVVEEFARVEKVNGFELGMHVDGLGQSIQMLNIADVRVSFGSHQEDIAEERDEDFYKFALDTNSLFFVPLPMTDASSRLILKSRWQYSDSSLPAFEQMSLGGANGVRAYSVRDFSADQAVMVNAEWYFDFPEFMNFDIGTGHRLNDVMQFGLLADAAYGSIVNFEDELENDWARLAGLGFILKFNWDDALAANISFAKPVSSISSVEGVGEDAESVEIYADITFFFQ